MPEYDTAFFIVRCFIVVFISFFSIIDGGVEIDRRELAPKAYTIPQKVENTSGIREFENLLSEIFAEIVLREFTGKLLRGLLNCF
jgi:hypothetical protein